jgi:hypothetical protein
MKIVKIEDFMVMSMLDGFDAGMCKLSQHEIHCHFEHISCVDNQYLYDKEDMLPVASHAFSNSHFTEP